MVLAFELLEPRDGLVVSELVDFGAECSLDPAAQLVPFLAQAADLVPGVGEVSPQGGQGQIATAWAGCGVWSGGSALVPHRLLDGHRPASLL